MSRIDVEKEETRERRGSATRVAQVSGRLRGICMATRICYLEVTLEIAMIMG
jgi:hypothetical protein